ncbi:hypothetical protein [Actinoplanes sp. NPDC020271]|uniref:hypothetical protein n=1 Tax=Actinoplanes sp. NPDC020271 TaxID=3363896 RepID=UPI00379D1126
MNLATLIACGICRLALTENRDGERVTFRHPVDDDSHDPQPVDARHLQPIFNRCHTCTAAPPAWDYRTGLIGIAAMGSGVLQTYNDHWHVCYRCAQFIEADDVDALTAHCAGLMHWRPASTQYTILNTLHRGIVLGRQERTLLTTTDWPAARINADMLPKIRDRLTGLLRGPAGLPTAIGDRQQRRDLANQLDRATMFWINEESTDLVNANSADQPVARATDALAPAPTGLIAWPSPVGETQQLAAVSWTPREDGWQFIGYHSVGNAVDEDLMPTLRHEIGWLIPIHAEYIARRAIIDGAHPLGPLMTTWLLIKQRMAETIPAQLPKGIRKSYQRNKRPAPEVRIVQIRPRRTTAPTPSDTPSASKKARAKPDHRFWVSGHERQQAYGPGRTLRKPIDIEPFLKGDDDLPIKLSTTVRVLGERSSDVEARREDE